VAGGWFAVSPLLAFNGMDKATPTTLYVAW